jgi:hypothetical protein
MQENNVLVAVVSQSARAMEAWESLSFAEYAVAYPQNMLAFTGAEHPSWGFAYYGPDKKVIRENWDSSG